MTIRECVIGVREWQSVITEEFVYAAVTSGEMEIDARRPASRSRSGPETADSLPGLVPGPSEPAVRSAT